MASKFILCISALLVNNIIAQSFGRPAQAYSPSFVNTYVSEDGCLTLTCTCPIAPNGVSVLSDLGIRGDVSVSGSLPFLSVVSLNGNLESSGQASVSYGCGDGNIAINQEINSDNGQVVGSSKNFILGNIRQ